MHGDTLKKLFFVVIYTENSKDGDVLPVNFSDFFFHSVLVKRVSYSRELHVCCVQFFSRSFPFRLESMGCMLMHQTPWLVHACQSICTGTCCLRHMGLVSIVIELMKYSVWKAASIKKIDNFMNVGFFLFLWSTILLLNIHVYYANLLKRQSFFVGWTLKTKTSFRFDSPVWLMGKFYHIKPEGKWLGF